MATSGASLYCRSTLDELLYPFLTSVILSSQNSRMEVLLPQLLFQREHAVLLSPLVPSTGMPTALGCNCSGCRVLSGCLLLVLWPIQLVAPGGLLLVTRATEQLVFLVFGAGGHGIGGQAGGSRAVQH